MMKKIVLLFSLAGALLLTACGPREIPAKGDFTVRVFDDTPVRFAPDIYPEAYNAPGADSIYHLVNGRIILKNKHPLQTDNDEEKMSKLFIYDDFKEDYKILNQEVRKLGYNIPPLVNAYMGLSPTMKMFGTAINDEFGNVEESGILIAIKDIIAEKRSRYIETYDKLPPIKIS